MDQLCQLFIYKLDNTEQYIGVITGFQKQIYKIKPDDILSDIFYSNYNLKISKDSQDYNLFNFLELSDDSQEQYDELVNGLRFLINKCIDTNKPLSLFDIELLKPFYDITHVFTPISKNNNPNAVIVSSPIHYSTFSIADVLSNKREIYHDFLYYCFSPADIIFSLLHFQALTQMKYGKCRHCKRIYATRDLRNEYCRRNSQYPHFEKYTCYEAKKEILRELTNTRHKIHNNLLTNDLKDRADIFKNESSEVINKAKKEPTYENFDKCFEIIDKNKWNKKGSFRNTIKHY